MTDDIVTRLRKPLPYNLVGLTTKDLGNERYEAADEIERLRADRDHWRSIAEQAVDNADQAVKLLEKLTGISHD